MTAVTTHETHQTRGSRGEAAEETRGSRITTVLLRQDVLLLGVLVLMVAFLHGDEPAVLHQVRRRQHLQTGPR